MIISMLPTVTLGTGAQSLGVEGRLFTRTAGQAITSPYTSAEIVTIDNTVDLDNNEVSVSTKEIPLSYLQSPTVIGRTLSRLATLC